MPARFEDVIFDNIATHAHDAVVLSWAAPGQPHPSTWGTSPAACPPAQSTVAPSPNSSASQKQLAPGVADTEVLAAGILARATDAILRGAREPGGETEWTHQVQDSGVRPGPGSSEPPARSTMCWIS